MLEKSNVSPIDKSKEYGYDTKGVVLGITVTSKTIYLGSAERQATVPVNFPPEKKSRVVLVDSYFTCNEEVVGSSPTGRRNLLVAQLVER